MVADRLRPSTSSRDQPKIVSACLFQDVISPQLTAAQRGRRVRQLAAMTHPGPDGTEVRVSCQTISRWKRDYLAGGFDALVPAPRQARVRKTAASAPH